VISTSGFKDRLRYIIVAKRILASLPAANRNEKRRAKASVKSDCMIELFPNWTVWEDLSFLSGRAIEVNRPYLRRPTSDLPNVNALVGGADHRRAIRNVERFRELRQIREWPVHPEMRR